MSSACCNRQHVWPAPVKSENWSGHDVALLDATSHSRYAAHIFEGK